MPPTAPRAWAMAPPYYYQGPPLPPPPPPPRPLPQVEQEQEHQQLQKQEEEEVVVVVAPAAAAAEEEKEWPGAGGGAGGEGGAGGSEGGGDAATSLRIGGLLPWMDEDYLNSCFTRSPELLSVVIERNKKTGESEGSGLLNFADHDTADQILKSYNGQEMPDAGKDFELNWVTNASVETEARADDDSEHTIYVGGLAYDVTGFMLEHVFKCRYPSVKSAKVIWDTPNSRSKGYGFVVFGDANEYRQAKTEMNGAYCSSRPMRIGSVPTNKKHFSPHDTQGAGSDDNQNNSKLFVGSLDSSVTDEDLKQAFSPYGEIVYVKVIGGKRCGFVEYSNRASAEEAIRMLEGSQIAGHTIRVSWGRRAAKNQDQWNGGFRGHGCSQDRSMKSYMGHRYYQQQHPVQ